MRSPYNPDHQLREVKPMTKEIITQDELKEHFDYNKETGVFIRLKTTSSKAIKDNIVGFLSHGYLVVSFNRRSYRLHRLAWLYMTGKWPKDQIDHINHDRTDNRWGNLRAVTNKDNSKNATMNVNNTSGFAGVYWDKDNQKWKAQIMVDGICRSLGRYTEKSHAVIARWMAADEAGFHKNHGASK